MDLIFRSWRRRTPAVVALAATLLCAPPPTAGAVAATAYRLSAGPFAGRSLYVSPRTTAAAAAAAERDPAARALLTRLASVPQAIWLTGGSPSTASSTVSRAVRAASGAGQVTEFVVYDIPRRDCTGGRSAGGAASPAAYEKYVAAIAAALRRAHTIIVLEPDALAGLDCLGSAARSTRLSLLRWATARLAARPHVLVYLDAGNRGWQSAGTMARRLSRAGIARARGFALDVANFDPTPGEVRYGRRLSSMVGGKRFVVDVSRNGTSPRVSGWCNPGGAALGALPGTLAGHPRVDALLWIKHPGESDGVCGASSEPAGAFDVDLALSLARRAGW